MSYKIFYKSLFLLVCVWLDLAATQRGGNAPRINSGTGSQITVNAGSSLKNSSSTMNAGKAKINVNTGAIAEGLPIGFVQGGIALNNGSSTTFTGSYSPATATVTVANSSWRGQSGSVNASVELSDGASMEGIPDVSNPVSVASGATASLGVQSTVNSNIRLNSSTANLKNDLKFGDGNQLVGVGKILGNGKSAILGGRDLIITSSVQWVDADIVVNSRLTLYGQWTFANDIHMLGRGNLLDLTHGGQLIIKDNTTLYLANLNIKGLNSDNLIFEGQNSKIKLSSTSLGFDSNYTLTIGQVYVDGPASCILGNNILTFAGSAFLTVDEKTLFYDTLTFDDQKNIKPVPADDPTQIYIKYLNGGRIMSYIGGSEADLIRNNSNAIVWLDQQMQTIDHGPNNIRVNALTYTMSYDYFLSNDHVLDIQSSSVFNGGGHFINFANDNAGTLNIADASNVVLRNVVLRNFKDTAVQLGAGASLIFGDGVVVELTDGQTMTMPWAFEGTATINAFGNTLDLGLKNIQIMQGGNLTIQNTSIQGLADYNLRCVGNATITLKNDRLNTLHEDYSTDSPFSFTSGSLVFDQNVKFRGIFEYLTNQPSMIRKDSRLIFESMYPISITQSYSPISIFVYEPIIANRDLIMMEDFSSELHLNGCALISSSTGMRLINGSVFVEGKNYILGSGSSISEAISFGNINLPSSDLFVNIMPGGSLEVMEGILDINTEETLSF
ncbi:MAG: hypothetical protein US49_C0006G0080 [candidate division TM6 bacterium GW2011_GWF2_37_49]|nr:MAG: hypothetical protein US49_C0006G0080 [candidate division TM6 bacterium GW2011_GWF2_37_49]